MRKGILLRTALVFTGMVLFALRIGFELVQIQVNEGDHWRSMADSIGTREFPIEATRGSIYDCKGNLLATSLPIYDVRVDAMTPAFQDEELLQDSLDNLARGLASIFKDKSADEYRTQLLGYKKRKARYALFKTKISYREMRAMSKLPIFNLGKNKGGLLLTERSRRVKPFGYLAERTLGFRQEMGAEKVRVGLEGFFDAQLAGRSGKRVMQRIAGGTWVPINEDLTIDAQQGRDLITTIDINLQDVAEHALLNTLMANDADYGTAILMEVATGEIRALANLTRTSPGNYSELYNYAVGESIEPGSTFKLISSLALVDDGYMKEEDVVDAEGGQIRFCNTVMKDSHLGTGVVTLRQAFSHSSNVAFAKLMQKSYLRNPEKVYAHYKALGLTEKLNLQINGVGAPVVKGPDSKSWSCTSLPYMAIGYELRITPLQLLTVYNAIANDGKLVSPLLVKEIVYSGKPVQRYASKVLNPAVCKPETVKTLRRLMESVVTSGTASELKSDFYTYAGKTGTAVIAADRRGYQAGGAKSYRASFCGYFPAENPKYSCMVLISRPRKDNYYASKVALPVFKEIADKVYASALNLHRELRFVQNNPTEDLPVLALSSKHEVRSVMNNVGLSSHYHNDSISEDQTDWVKGAPQDRSVAFEPVMLKRGIIPDLRGMGVRDALLLLERKGLQVRVEGYGKVKYQSLNPGTPVRKNQIIQLRLG